MANILEFLRSNPEMAFRLLQAGGGALGQIGGQFDEASAYNSQARAGRRNSLVGALSLGQVPGTAQGRMPSPGFLSTLGQGAELIGGMGSMAYDLKRQKAEEEYQKEMRKIEKQRQELQYKNLTQENQMNTLTLGDKEKDAKQKEGATLYKASLASAVNAWVADPQHKGKKKEEIPEFNPQWLTMPSSVAKASPEIQAGWQAAAEHSFDVYTDRQIALEKQRENTLEAQTRALNAKEMLAARQAQLKSLGLEKEARDTESKFKYLNMASKEAEVMHSKYKIPDTEIAMSNIDTGFQQGRHGLMMIGVERLINTGTVFQGELERDIAMAMSPSAEVMKQIHNALLTPAGQPIQMSDAAAKVMHDFARGIVKNHLQLYDQHLDGIRQKYKKFTSRSGVPLDPVELESAFEGYKPTTFIQESPQNPAEAKVRELQQFRNQRSLLPEGTQEATPEGTQSKTDSSKGGFFGGDTLESDYSNEDVSQGGVGNIFGGDSPLPSWLMAGGGLYGAKKALDKWGSSILPPGSGTTPTPDINPSIFSEVSGEIVPPSTSIRNTPAILRKPFNIPQSQATMIGQSSPLPPRNVAPNTFLTDPSQFTLNSPDPSYPRATELPKIEGREGFKPIGSSYRVPNSSPWSPTYPVQKGINPQDFAPSSYNPDIPFDNPDAPPSGYNANAYGKMAQESKGQQFRTAMSNTPVEKIGSAEKLTPSALLRMAKQNPALVKALGFLDSADRYTGGFAGGLVNTKMLQDWVNKAIYGPRGYD